MTADTIGHHIGPATAADMQLRAVVSLACSVARIATTLENIANNLNNLGGTEDLTDALDRLGVNLARNST